MSHAIEASDLRKRYGRTTVLDGVDLAVEPGTVCGLLGPNGAGKTTTVRILTTLTRADAGHAVVGGADVRRAPGTVRGRIGLVGQHAALDEVLSGRQNLVLFARLHRLGRRQARRRADELLDRFGLVAAADRSVSTYSGGMRRRLDLAVGTVVAPPVLFLDEPTTGLDPRSRTEVWTAVRDLVRDGTTVLLTTQYLEEADQLADRICVLADGRVRAVGTPDALKSALGGDRVEVVLRHGTDLPVAARVAAGAAGAAGAVGEHVEPREAGAGPAPGAAPGVEVDADRRRVSVPAAGRSATLVAVATALSDAGLEVEDVGLRRPTLDEVFLGLTGGPGDGPGDGGGPGDGPGDGPEDGPADGRAQVHVGGAVENGAAA